MERNIWPGVGEQAGPLADDNGIDEKVYLVDQIVREQPSDE